MTMMTHLKADNNIDDLKRLVDDIISGVENDEEKTLAILEWFNLSARNIFNNYFLKEDGIFLIPIGKIAIIFGEPYIGIRTYDNDDSLWILTSRYGHCGEYGLLFRDMANAAGLSVRMVVCPGEDHVWDEVLIDNTWIIIDPTRVGSAPDNGYNLMWNFMEIKAKGNISYVYADYLNTDVKEDITFRYTEKLTNITILATDSDGSPLSDVTVSLKSNNRYLNHPAGLIKKTNASGKCHYNIGDGDYTFELSTDGIIPLVGSYSGIFKADQSYVERVELHLDWVRVILIVFIVFICFIVGLIYFLRVRKKE